MANEKAMSSIDKRIQALQQKRADQLVALKSNFRETADLFAPGRLAKDAVVEVVSSKGVRIFIISSIAALVAYSLFHRSDKDDKDKGSLIGNAFGEGVRFILRDLIFKAMMYLVAQGKEVFQQYFHSADGEQTDDTQSQAPVEVDETESLETL